MNFYQKSDCLRNSDGSKRQNCNDFEPAKVPKFILTIADWWVNYLYKDANQGLSTITIFFNESINDSDFCMLNPIDVGSTSFCDILFP